MLVVETFLRRGDGAVVPMADVGRIRNPRTVNGGIRLVADRQPVLDEAWWCRIDLLWAEIGELLHDLAATGRAEVRYPGSPVHVGVHRLFGGGKYPRVRVSVTGIRAPRTVVVDEPDFAGLLRTGGDLLFRHLIRVCPANAGTYERHRARLLAA